MRNLLIICAGMFVVYNIGYFFGKYFEKKDLEKRQ